MFKNIPLTQKAFVLQRNNAPNALESVDAIKANVDMGIKT